MPNLLDFVNGGWSGSLEGAYNSPLTPSQNLQYQNLLSRIYDATGRDLNRDLYDYDLQGAYAAGIRPNGGHLPDTYKKPNHPTFSAESRYSTAANPGGQWVQQNGQWVFIASPANLQYQTPEQLRRYFQEAEPNANLLLPP